MYQSFEPPKRTLLGPGPSDIPQTVLAALGKPTIGHLDPCFIALMDDIKKMLQEVFQTENHVTFPISAPGSAGMEACFVNLVEPGDEVLVCTNGVFGLRMQSNVERIGGKCHVLAFEWGQPVDPAQVDSYLAANAGIKIVAFVHAETSTGVLSDGAAIAAMAHKHNCLTIVDTVTSLGGLPVKVDDWGLDAVYSGSQKCLSCPPGLSPVTFNERALDKLAARKTKVQSWFLDLSLQQTYWGDGKRSYHHTAPVNSLYGLHEALRLVLDEGLNKVFARHREIHLELVRQLSQLGIEMVVKETDRLPQLNAVKIPAGVDEATVRSNLLNKHGIEIGAGLGAFAGKIWRIGLMGHSARQENVAKLVSALKAELRSLRTV